MSSEPRDVAAQQAGVQSVKSIMIRTEEREREMNKKLEIALTIIIR